MTSASEIKILIVEDEGDFRELLLNRFQIFGFSVAAVSNGNKAWELFKKDNFDIIISDIRMPNSSGVELLKKIRQFHYANPKVYIISGFSDYSTRHLLDLGAGGFFPKPFNAAQLRDTIQKALMSRRFRWLHHQNLNSVAVIKYQAENMEEAKQKYGFELGHGGFRLNKDNHTPSEGDFIEFHLQVGFPLNGIGRVVWREKEDKYELGVEILSLQKESLDPSAIGLRLMNLRLIFRNSGCCDGC